MPAKTKPAIEGKTGSMPKLPDKEDNRQVFHMTFGLLMVIFAIIAGKTNAEFGLIAIILTGLTIANSKLLGWKNEQIDYFLKKYERDVNFPGKGALMLTIGMLFALVFSKTFEMAIATMAILAIGDGVSTIIGKRGKISLPWNNKKTIEGTAAFAISAILPAFYFTPSPYLALAIAAIFAFIESIDVFIDDNLSIPMTGAILSHLI